MSTLRDNIYDIIQNSYYIDKFHKKKFNDSIALMNIMKEIEEGPKLLMNLDNVRNVVDWYAKRMEKRLREKDATRGKDGWHDGKLYYYLAKSSDCMRAIISILEITITRGNIIQKKNSDIKEKDIHFAIKKCIDGGNFLMMLADNLRDILLERDIKK